MKDLLPTSSPSHVALRFVLAILSCITAVNSVTARQVEQSQELLPIDPAVRSGTLDNGIRYVIRKNDHPENRAELRLVVNAGSILEDDTQRGLAHFVEHMAFNGTTHFRQQELVEFLESIGMQFGPDINAYTSFDETVYQLQIPTDSAGVLETGISVLREWSDGVTFDPVEVEKERGVVIEEWRGRLGAAARIQDQQLPVMVAGSRYAERLPIGTLENLESFSLESLIRFYRDWYRPELISIVAVGDFDDTYVETLIRNNFSDIPRAMSPRDRTAFLVPENIEPRYTIVSDPEATRSIVSVTHRRIPVSDGTRDAYRRGILGTLYSSMLNQRLYELTQTSDPPFVAAGSSDGGLGFARSVTSYDLAALVQKGDYVRALETLLTEAERIRQFGFSNSELDRVKTNYLRGMEIAYNERDNSESGAFAGEYVRHLLDNEAIPGIAYEFELTRDLLPGITVEELNDLTSFFMTTENRVVSISGPENDAQPLPSEADVIATFARVTRSELMPYQDASDSRPLLAVLPTPGEIVNVSNNEKTGVSRLYLSNGVQVVLKATDFKKDQILFRGSSAGGYSLASDETFISALMAAQIVMGSGIGEFDPTTLQKKLTGIAASVSPFISSLSQGFSGSASPDDIETLFQLMHLYATEPRTDRALFQSFISRMTSLLENQAASPQTAFSDTLSAVLSQYHSRARPLTAERLTEIDLDESVAFYRNRFADFSDYTFYIVGAFDRTKIESLVKTYLASLPTSEKPALWRDQGIRPPFGVEERTVYAGVEPRSQVAIVFSGEAPWTIEKRRRLSVLQKVLDVRLREILREDLGGTYGVSVSASLTDEPYESYAISISFGCSPDRVDELIGQVFSEIESLKNAFPGDTYLHNAREATVRAHETGLQENGYWLSSLRFYDQHGISYEQILESPSAYLNMITEEDIVSEARDVLDETRYVSVVLRPVKEDQ